MKINFFIKNFKYQITFELFIKTIFLKKLKYPFKI